MTVGDAPIFCGAYIVEVWRVIADTHVPEIDELVIPGAPGLGCPLLDGAERADRQINAFGLVRGRKTSAQSPR
jgi:hypothetical protein